jgi:WXG100 family type VII secretion target
MVDMQFIATPDELKSAAAKTSLTNTQIQAQILAMQAYVVGLMAAYRGRSAIALSDLTERWNADAKALGHVLTTIADGLTSNANNYVSSEAANSTNLSNIAASLPAARF